MRNILIIILTMFFALPVFGEKRVKNTTVTARDHTNTGTQFIASGFTEVDESILFRYNDTQLWDWFDSGVLQFDDGTTTYTDKNEGWARLFQGAFGIPFLDDDTQSNGFESDNVQEAIEEARSQGSARAKISFLLQRTGEYYRYEATTGYNVHAMISFDGTTQATPTSIKAVCRVSLSGGSGGSIKVFDLTNGNTIVEKTGVTSTSFALVDLGTLSNLSSGQAIWEIHLKSSAGSGQFQVSYLEINF